MYLQQRFLCFLYLIYGSAENHCYTTTVEGCWINTAKWYWLSSTAGNAAWRSFNDPSWTWTRYQAVHIDLIKQWWCLKASLNWYIGAYKFVLLTDLCIFASCIFFIEKKSNVRCYLLKILFKWFIHAFMYAFISLLLGIDIIYIYLRTF